MPSTTLADPNFDLNDVKEQDIPGIPPPLNVNKATENTDSTVVAPEPLAEGNSVESNTPDTAKEVIAKIVPQVDPVERILTWNNESKVYTQRQLSVFRKLSLFEKFGSAIEEIVDGPDGVNIDAIFGDAVPGSIDDFRSADLGELTTFVSAIAKIATYAPEFLKESFLIILNVPHNEKAFALEALDEIDDQMFEDVVTTFIDQNYDALTKFFTERSLRINQHIQALRNPS